MNNGVYYLHTNGSMIYKPSARDPRDFEESDFVERWWWVDITNRGNAWQIVLEATALGANEEDIKRLADKWRLNYNDSLLMRQNMRTTSLMDLGFERFCNLVFGKTIPK